MMLSKKIILGAGWSVSSRLGGRLIDFVTVLVLARTLTPADFGLTALANTLIAVVDTVLEVPLIQALTRLKTVERSQLDTAFTLGLLRGLLVALFVLSASYPFTIIYSDSRLALLVAVLALGPIARSLYSPAMVKFIRLMSFRQTFMSEFIGKVSAAAIAIVTVYLGGGYWAIAVGSITSSIIATLVSYILAPYRPRLTLADISDFSKLLGWFSLAQISSALSWQFDRALLGSFVTKAHLGQYTMAGDLAVLPTQSLIGPAMQPVMAAFSRIHDDRERLASAYLKSAHITMMLAAPACVGMSAAADLIVKLLLGTKWDEASIYLSWLALATVLSAYCQPLYSLAFAVNKTRAWFYIASLDLCLKVILTSGGLYFYSLMGVVAARGVASVVIFFATLLAARELIRTKMTTQIVNLWKIGASCGVMFLLVVFLRHQLAGKDLDTLLELCIVAAFGATVYVAALLALGLRPGNMVALLSGWRADR